MLPSFLLYSTVTDRPLFVLALLFTLTTFPLSSVARTASWFVWMSIPLCTWYLLVSKGSFLVPKGEVTSINSSLFRGKEYFFSSVSCTETSFDVAWRGLSAVPKDLPSAFISCITIWSYFCNPFFSIIFWRVAAYCLLDAYPTSCNPFVHPL